jgi:hypothetical protein
VPKARVHIGTHKTGTTSFQAWGGANRAEIQRLTGYRFYESLWGGAQIELPILSLRPELDMHARKVNRPWVTPEVEQEMRDHIRSQLNGDNLIISAEGLSFIRFPEEVDRLRELLDPYELEFIVVQRERADFLRSYTQWMQKVNITQSDDPSSVRYVGADSWILDFEEFPNLFPGIQIIDYNKAMSEQGSVIPAIMEGLVADTSTLPPWSEYKLNPAPVRKRFMMLRRIKRRLMRYL